MQVLFFTPHPALQLHFPKQCHPMAKGCMQVPRQLGDLYDNKLIIIIY
jgi:hypothetical protein